MNPSYSAEVTDGSFHTLIMAFVGGEKETGAASWQIFTAEKLTGSYVLSGVIVSSLLTLKSL